MEIESVIFFKECVTILATLVATSVAVWGLNSWKRQLKGSADYDLARRLLKLTFRLRGAIQNVRNPFMWGHEQPTPSETESQKMTRDDLRFYGLAKAYESRWKKVLDIHLDLQAELLEAEAVWGKAIHDKYQRLFQLQKELHLDLIEYLEVCNPNQSQDIRDAYVKIRKEHREVLYDTSRKDRPDEFTADLTSAISTIEDFIKPYLRK